MVGPRGVFTAWDIFVHLQPGPAAWPGTEPSMYQASSINRRKTRRIMIGSVPVGGDAPVMVQSMCNTDTRDPEATGRQIAALARAGCEVVRVAVPDEVAANALRAIVDASPVPLVADIHFDHRLAIAALESGIQALRINPGNIGGRDKVDRVVDAAKAHHAPIRVGVNSGSVDKKLIAKYGGPTPEAMVESALAHVAMLEERNFHDTKISLKSSSVLHTIAAYRLLAERCDYPPAHRRDRGRDPGCRLGKVRRGPGYPALGGHRRHPAREPDPRSRGPSRAWPTASCAPWGFASAARRSSPAPHAGARKSTLSAWLSRWRRNCARSEEVFTVAVMGCVVNGPGEAREADIGIAGGRGLGIIFKKGEVVRKVKGDANLLPALMEEIEALLEQRRS